MSACRVRSMTAHDPLRSWPTSASGEIAVLAGMSARRLGADDGTRPMRKLANPSWYRAMKPQGTMIGSVSPLAICSISWVAQSSNAISYASSNIDNRQLKLNGRWKGGLVVGRYLATSLVSNVEEPPIADLSIVRSSA